MPTEGPNTSTSQESSAANGGTIAWSNPANTALSDTSRAVAICAGTAISEWLVVYAFGFAIDLTDTIVGVEVSIERRRSVGTTGHVIDSEVYLIDRNTLPGPPAPVAVSANKASGSNWPTSDTVATYGGAADLWSASPTLTPNIVNSSDFGVAVAVAGDTGSADRQAQLDFISVTIYSIAVAGGSIPVLSMHHRRMQHMS